MIFNLGILNLKNLNNLTLIFDNSNLNTEYIEIIFNVIK